MRPELERQTEQFRQTAEQQNSVITAAAMRLSIHRISDDPMIETMKAT